MLPVACRVGQPVGEDVGQGLDKRVLFEMFCLFVKLDHPMIFVGMS